jgi:hypothetical protein
MKIPQLFEKYEFEDLKDESAKFVYENACKRLENILDTSEKTTNRATYIILGIIPFIGFVLTNLYKYYSNESPLICFVLYLNWSAIIVSLILLAFLIYIVSPREMYQPGLEPSSLIVDDFLKHPKYQEEQYKRMLVKSFELLQGKIEYMQSQTDKRVILYKYSLLGIFAYFIVVLIIMTIILV